MEQLITQLDTLGWLNVALWIVFFAVYNTIMYRMELLKAAKGDDGILQMVEWFFISWALVFPFFMVAVMGLKIEAPELMYTTIQWLGPTSTTLKLTKDGYKMYINNNQKEDADIHD